MDWLAQKLERAACYADGIINWGYFPYIGPRTVALLLNCLGKKRLTTRTGITHDALPACGR